MQVRIQLRDAESAEKHLETLEKVLLRNGEFVVGVLNYFFEVNVAAAARAKV